VNWKKKVIFIPVTFYNNLQLPLKLQILQGKIKKDLSKLVVTSYLLYSCKTNEDKDMFCYVKMVVSQKVRQVNVWPQIESHEELLEFIYTY
jgi:hypothetical protein